MKRVPLYQLQVINGLENSTGIRSFFRLHFGDFCHQTGVHMQNLNGIWRIFFQSCRTSTLHSIMQDINIAVYKQKSGKWKFHNGIIAFSSFFFFLPPNWSALWHILKKKKGICKVLILKVFFFCTDRYIWIG